ncbi:M56 family metallopeptidase [Dyadobacter sp. CY312]|uniref:M56 family metallopeptidase n=1 Tax=Dyadobacter sp. CY312 TaxID=2907303 RepID=UPI001F38400A|nr:M56 family metallopeptidase [Dyadobacter sp. CY312]MCE7043435.1 M56 family metallopeptidase [Dyadobacter sp. CY312]
MSPLLEYVVKLSISLTLITVFYHFVLRKYTFFNWNRWYLLGYSLLAFIIPFIDVEYQLRETKLSESGIVKFVPVVQDLTVKSASAPVINPGMSQVSYTDMLLYLLVTGAAVVFMTRIISLFSFYKIRSRSRLISDAGVKVFQVEKNIAPFSFGNSIFLNRNLHGDSDLKEIMLHEFIHVKQKHTIDIIWSEVLCILNWYNPFAWMLRSAIRQNLEYIADRAVLENGVDAKSYQYLLLKVVGVPEFRIANQFNFSSLKQRIIMMNKMKTAKIQLIRFLFVLPLISVLLVAFRSNIEQQFVQNKNTIYIAGLLVDGETGKRVSNMPLKLEISSENKLLKKIIKSDGDGFYYYELDTQKFQDSVVYYGLSGQGEYEKFAMGSSLKKDVPGDGEFLVSFLTRDDEIGNKIFKRHTTFPYYVPKDSFFNSGKFKNIRNDIKQYLDRKESEFRTEYDLKVAFAEAYPQPKEILTKFKNAYFDGYGKLVGYDGVLKVYLNDLEVDYRVVNEAFKDKKFYEVFGINQNAQAYDQTQSTILYYTYKLVSQAPPTDLLENNYEYLDVNAFDLKRLDKEPCLVNGFRNAKKVGFGQEPLREEIKNIILLKGDLAGYYDNKLSEILWIETWPVEKIRGRPAFEEK